MRPDPVHWLRSRDAEASACGVKSRHAMYSSCPEGTFVSCKKCLKTLKTEATRRISSHE